MQEFDRRFGRVKLQDIDPMALQAFIDEYFEPAGAELEECELKEWVEFPPRLMRIRDPALRDWALKLNAIWKLLCRKVCTSECLWFGAHFYSKAAFDRNYMKNWLNFILNEF